MRCTLAAIAAPFVVSVGCVTSPFGDEGWTFPGGTDSIIVVEHSAELFDPGGGTLPPTPKEVWSVDLASGNSTVALSQVAAFTNDVVANESWIAWLDRETNTIFAHERAKGVSGEQPGGQELTDTQTATAFPGQLLGIVGDLLVGQTAGQDDGAGCYDFVLVNLATKHVQTIGNSWQYPTFATDGHYFAFVDCFASNVEVLSLELSANIRLADLATGLVQVIRPNIRVSGSGPVLFLRNGVLYWEEFYNGSFRSRVRAFEIATNELTNRFEDFDSDIRERDLLAVGDDYGIVVSRGSEPARDFNKAGKLEIWWFDGNRTLLEESVALQQSLFFDSVWIVGNRIVWANPADAAREYIVHDLATESKRRIAAPSK